MVIKTPVGWVFCGWIPQVGLPTAIGWMPQQFHMGFRMRMGQQKPCCFFLTMLDLIRIEGKRCFYMFLSHSDLDRPYSPKNNTKWSNSSNADDVMSQYEELSKVLL